MTPDEVMERAADLLDEHDWNRGRFRSKDGNLCMLGALNMVCYPNSNGNVDVSRYSELPTELLEARVFLEDVLGLPITNWNDVFCTGRSDATALLRDQAKQYREEHQ